MKLIKKLFDSNCISPKNYDTLKVNRLKNVPISKTGESSRARNSPEGSRNKSNMTVSIDKKSKASNIAFVFRGDKFNTNALV